MNVTAPPLPTFTRSDSINSSVTGFGHLYPQATLRWNNGVNNFMVYGTGDIPVGAYQSTRLANLGIGHGAADGGAGYTYLNPAAGQEFSAVAGLTYNLENPFTNYQNGVDFHLDWAASQFLLKQVFVGPVGYVYDQLSCDSGSGDRVGCFEFARHRHRPADWISVPGRQYAGLSEFQGLRGIRRGGSTVRLECVGLVRALAGRGCANNAHSDGLQMTRVDMMVYK